MTKSRPVKEEEEITTLRQHSIFLLWPLSWVILGLAVVGLIFWFTGASFLFSLTFFLWLIFGGGFAFFHWYRWRMNQYIFTTERIIVREQSGFFKRISAEIKLDQIVDITYRVVGIWATLFNFGDLYIKGEGRGDPLVLANIYRPGQVQEELLELKDKFLEEKELTAEELVKKVQQSKA